MASDPSLRISLPPTDPAAAPVANPTAGAAQVAALPQTAPPVLSATSGVVTQVSELPKTTPLAVKLAVRRLPPPSASDNLPHLTPVAASADLKSPAINRSQPGTHWADVGLLGMAAVGGLFCWRTRRASPAKA